jgi:predicted O-methyltransferase YrrM
MKDRADAILRPVQAEYLQLLLPPSDSLLAEMERTAGERRIPISDPEVGRLLELLARSCRAQRVLEIGTAIGYGTLCLARGASEATIVSLDRDPEMQAEALTWLERGGVADRVEMRCGEALDLLPGLAEVFDLAYVDAEKPHLRRFLDLLLPKLAVGGLVVIDNLLWKGRVASDDTDDEVEAIRAFNGYLMMHPQLCSVMLPLGDGVGLATKTKPLITEMGGPF